LENTLATPKSTFTITREPKSKMAFWTRFIGWYCYPLLVFKMVMYLFVREEEEEDCDDCDCEDCEDEE
jgi:hypothetical protein